MGLRARPRAYVKPLAGLNCRGIQELEQGRQVQRPQSITPNSRRILKLAQPLKHTHGPVLYIASYGVPAAIEGHLLSHTRQAMHANGGRKEGRITSVPAA